MRLILLLFFNGMVKIAVTNPSTTQKCACPLVQFQRAISFKFYFACLFKPFFNPNITLYLTKYRSKTIVKQLTVLTDNDK